MLKIIEIIEKTITGFTEELGKILNLFFLLVKHMQVWNQV